MDKDGFLRQVPLFQSLRPEDIQNLCDSTRTHSCKKGDVLFRKGSEGTTLYIIKKGRIKIVLPSKDGDEVILAIFSEKYFFGENRFRPETERSCRHGRGYPRKHQQGIKSVA
ncbi:MAG: cyclic nucleotide-binding domain-containing protein [Deltaproteobacteria bacterium]|nr:cyclic nucleotide-binding domain-containing protein [Deltaproteobacteria bacterium]